VIKRKIPEGEHGLNNLGFEIDSLWYFVIKKNPCFSSGLNQKMPSFFLNLLNNYIYEPVFMQRCIYTFEIFFKFPSNLTSAPLSNTNLTV
jgi:hypothetical protein